jgi:hypothetical protein
MQRLTKHHHCHHWMLTDQYWLQYAWHHMLPIQMSLLADEDALIPSPTAAQPDAIDTSPPSPAYDNTAPISDAMQQ